MHPRWVVHHKNHKCHWQQEKWYYWDERFIPISKIDRCLMIIETETIFSIWIECARFNQFKLDVFIINFIAFSFQNMKSKMCQNKTNHLEMVTMEINSTFDRMILRVYNIDFNAHTKYSNDIRLKTVKRTRKRERETKRQREKSKTKTESKTYIKIRLKP